MGVETGNWISDLNPSWPDDNLPDDIAQGAEHLRLTKRFVQQSLPNVSGAANPTHIELNTLVGIDVSKSIQQQLDDLGGAGVGEHTHDIADVLNLQAALDAKASLISPSFSGSPTVPTASPGSNNAVIASTAYVDNALNGGGGETPSLDPRTTFHFINTSGAMLIQNTTNWNVGFLLQFWPANSPVELLYGFNNIWISAGTKTNSNGDCFVSQPASRWWTAWTSAGGGSGFNYIKLRPALAPSLEFTQNVQVS